MAVPIAIIAAGAIVALTIFYVYGLNFSVKPINKNSSDGFNPESASKNDLNNIKSVSEKDHILGNLNASIKLIEFSDTECPFCKKFHSTMKEIIKNYDGKAVWVYRHFPIEQLHPVKARAEANALECANELGGSSAFWDYLDKLFEATPSNNQLDQNLLPAIAENIGVDRARFESCLASDKYAAHVSEDWQDAAMIGAEATPFTVIISPNGKKYSIVGAQSYTAVASVIDQALKEK